MSRGNESGGNVNVITHIYVLPKPTVYETKCPGGKGKGKVVSVLN
jgi:hypothetical protein